MDFHLHIYINIFNYVFSIQAPCAKSSVSSLFILLIHHGLIFYSGFFKIMMYSEYELSIYVD